MTIRGKRRHPRKRDGAYISGFCQDCGLDVMIGRQYAYMLHNTLWRVITRKRQARQFHHQKKSTFDYLCIRCCERVLERQLQPEDFNWEVPLTCWDAYRRSKLLRSRMGLLA